MEEQEEEEEEQEQEDCRWRFISDQFHAWCCFWPDHLLASNSHSRATQLEDQIKVKISAIQRHPKLSVMGYKSSVTIHSVTKQLFSHRVTVGDLLFAAKRRKEVHGTSWALSAGAWAVAW